MRSGRRESPPARRIARHLLRALLIACPLAAFAHPVHDLEFVPQQSSAAFSVRLIWFQTISGHFEDMQGGVHIDPLDRMAHVHARIRVDSVKVHPAHYRERLLGEHFFDAATYPAIHFESSPLRMDELRNGTHLHGRLTLHGVTRPLTLQVQDTQCAGPGLDGCTLHLKGWLDRTRFGMRAYRALVSTRVRLDLVIRLRAVARIAPATTQSAASR